jgi:ubiquinone/menaquinone biosynthesis C-methylase UbiE
MQDNYDNIAFAYDDLSRLIFGKAQINAQTALLPYIKNGDRILIAGGGTGWILDEITKIHPAGLEIVYIESSHKMISRSEKRYSGLNKITFIQQPVEDIHLNQNFSVIITGFFFDNFELRKAESIFNYLDSLLDSGGRWLFIDFKSNPGKRYIWQHLMLKLMYFFFRLVCKIEATHLADMAPIFKRADYKTIFEKSGYGNFIHSTVYEKTR